MLDGGLEEGFVPGSSCLLELAFVVAPRLVDLFAAAGLLEVALVRAEGADFLPVDRNSR